MEDKTFELLEKMYSEFTEFRNETKEDIQALKNQVTGLENQVTKLEFDLKKDISALYDGYIQNTQQLDRIEKAVLRHEDIIIRKVK